jgi:excisionase family DNA binding protein
VTNQQQRNVSDINNNTSNLLDIDGAAQRLNIISHTVRAPVINRKITFVKLGARVLFRPQDVDNFIKSHLVQPQAGHQEEVS